ncbi:MAG: hypothetical protein BWY92_01952 [Firmicutes bacterium ADurb.BinA052]|nr:MAG: hypothetical protein BWY92_01952 [Firmicutes bacterium ADurb.BinA052]
MGFDFVIRSLVACRAHEEHARLEHRFFKYRVVPASAPGTACDPGAHLTRIVDSFDSVGIGASACAQEFARHDLRFPCNADSASAVVAHGAYSAADVCSVTVDLLIVIDRIVVVEEIPPVHVVYEPVPVVVDAIVRYFTEIIPDVACQVDVTHLDPSVNYHYENRRCVGTYTPGFRSMDIGAPNAFLPEDPGVEILPLVKHPPHPLLNKPGIVGEHRSVRVPQVVGHRMLNELAGRIA